MSGRSPGEGIGYSPQCSWASLVAQLVKNLPALWETWVRSLGWEDPLKKGKATHSSILAWSLYVHGVTKSWTQLSLYVLRMEIASTLKCFVRSKQVIFIKVSNIVPDEFPSRHLINFSILVFFCMCVCAREDFTK